MKKTTFFALSIFSWLIVALGQPAHLGFLGIAASCCGYAIFWHAISYRKKQFWISVAWFSTIQCFQFSWMFSHEQGGLGIIFATIAIAFWIGVQFGVISIFLKPLTFPRIILLSAVWVLFEWHRLFILSGFSWNFVGMALAGNLYSLQMASIFGLLGMSFWVMFVNLLVLKRKSFIFIAAIPFLFGIAHISYHHHKIKKSPKLNVSLVQTGLSLGEKSGLGCHPELFIEPIEQWRRIAMMIRNNETDLIVLPENALPYGAYRYAYTEDQAKNMLKKVFGEKIFESLPPTAFYSSYYECNIVNNAYIAQTLANYLQKPLILGIEDEENGNFYNAAFFFEKNREIPLRYEKRVLVPMGEYIPFKWARSLAAMHGVEESFSSGKEAKIFPATVPVGISICYEETYGHIMRENKQKGAQILINVSSDDWFPSSSLPIQHAEHARLRTVENGFPLARVNTNGFTMVVDSLGKTIAKIENQHKSEVLSVDVPLYTYKTLYTIYGDNGIVVLCFIIVLVYTISLFLRGDKCDKKN